MNKLIKKIMIISSIIMMLTFIFSNTAKAKYLDGSKTSPDTLARENDLFSYSVDDLLGKELVGDHSNFQPNEICLGEIASTGEIARRKIVAVIDINTNGLNTVTINGERKDPYPYNLKWFNALAKATQESCETSLPTNSYGATIASLLGDDGWGIVDYIRAYAGFTPAVTVAYSDKDRPYYWNTIDEGEYLAYYSSDIRQSYNYKPEEGNCVIIGGYAYVGPFIFNSSRYSKHFKCYSKWNVWKFMC